MGALAISVCIFALFGSTVYGNTVCFNKYKGYKSANLQGCTKTDTPDLCQQLCQQTSGCTRFNWLTRNYNGTTDGTAPRRDCCLKGTASEELVKLDDVVSGEKYCKDLSCYQLNHAHLSKKSTISIIPQNSVEDCQRLCQKTSGCHSFSYLTSNYDGSYGRALRKNCILQNTHEEHLNYDSADDIISGPKYCPGSQCFQQDSNYASANMNGACTKTSTVGECQLLCQNTDGCTRFAYLTNNYNGALGKQQQCCLKSSAVEKTVHEDDVITGPRYCSDDRCGRKKEPRIVGGKDAQPGAWPWTVASYRKRPGRKDRQWCGATLLNENWALSAAHCYYGRDAKEYSVKLGEHSLSKNSTVEQKIPVTDILLHPKYTGWSSSYDFDVALMHLKTPAMLNAFVGTACLPDRNTHFPVGTKCVISGWGDLTEGGDDPDVLQQASVPTVSLDTCNKAYDGKITDRMVCGGYPEGGTDTCQGDSGGPFVCRNKDVWMVTGVTSWGHGCARKGKYGVYANVQTLRPWIDHIMFGHKDHDHDH